MPTSADCGVAAISSESGALKRTKGRNRPSSSSSIFCASDWRKPQPTFLNKLGRDTGYPSVPAFANQLTKDGLLTYS
jgi:hypothetical protein